MANTKQSKILCAAKPKTVPTHRKRKGFAGYDIFGNVVVYKFSRDVKAREKKKIALKFLKENKSVRTVLEKTDKFKGRLRTQETKWVAGDKTKEVLYKENDCMFRFNVDSCYFSSRLSSERKDIASKVKKGENVLVMFGGVGPFAIVIAKLSKAGRVVSVELGRECTKYAKDNVKRNKLDNVEIVGGDVRKVLEKIEGKWDRMVMARPNLKDSFLDVAFSRIKKGGIIHYYGFTENRKFSVPKTLKDRGRVLGYSEEDKAKIKKMILEEAKKAGKEIRILGIKKAGEIGVKKFRWRVDVKVF